jgi:ABC-type uncharacterized transport system permease subunit
MPILWLRVALAFYSVGLIYALLSLTRAPAWLSRIAMPAMVVGMIFHFVSLTESVLLSGQLTLTSVHNPESLLALLIMTGFLIVYIAYDTSSPGIVIFPLVFLLTFIGATGEQPFLVTPGSRTGWLFVHIAMIFTGYAGLFLSFGASLVYLLQERNLKSKQPARIMLRLPSLQVIDDIGYRSLLLGFPFMTLGLIAGTIVAESTYGKLDLLDPKVLLSILMWAVYMVMLFTRWNAGWRGRKAAYLAAGAILVAVTAWFANYISNMHRFVQS